MKKPMNQVALNLAKLSDEGTVKRCRLFATGISSAEGAAVYIDPDPTVVAFNLLIANAEAKITAAEVAQRAATQATADKDAAIVQLVLGAQEWGIYVQKVSKGDPAKIALANMDIKGAATPIGPLGQVQSLAVTEGDKPGELDLIWDPMYGANHFEIQTCTDPNAGNWQFAASCSGSKRTLTGQTSGARIWCRVRAIAPAEENSGAWSDPAVKIVP
jgi:hypothetical protein